MQQKLRSALQRFPRLKKCTIFKDEEDSFALTLSWPDGEADKSRVGIQRFTSTRPLGCAQLLHSTVVSQTASPTNNRVASLIVEDTADSEKKKFRVEVWDCFKGQIASVQVEDVHGAFLASEGLTWHDSEEMFAYIAEKKPVSSTGGVAPSPPMDAFLYREDWGEQYDGVCQPTIVLFDVNLAKATASAVPSTKSQFQPCFSPSTAHGPSGMFALAYTSFEHDPFKLGLIYCAQRPCEVRLAVFQKSSGTPGAELSLKTDAAVSIPSRPGLGTAKSPRFTPDGKKLVFLSAPKFDTHQGAMQLSLVDVNPASSYQVSSPPRIVVDTSNNSSFPCLYLESLPTQCFHGDHVYMTTLSGSRRRIARVNLVDGTVKWVGDDNTSRDDDDDNSPKRRRTHKDVHSRACLAVSPNTGRMLIVQSSPTNPGVVRWLEPDEKNDFNDNIKSSIVFDLGSQVKQQIVTEILVHKPLDGGNTQLFESILIYPGPDLTTEPNQEKLPLIVYPHGGPHSAFSTDYSGEMAFICEELKVGILMVNYRGSIGPDRVSTLETLPGKCGDQDVKDCMVALKDCLHAHAHLVDPTKLAVMGGSHGGYLTAHLSGQHPDAFKCAVLRNPVIDIAAMATVTDIPDWCYVEALGLGAFDFANFSNFPPTPELYTKMFNQSPMRYIDAVKLPTLIAIGDKDRRVPPSQGLTYYRALKIRGVDVSLMRFPKDTHAIDRAMSNEINWTAAIDFLKKHLHIQ